MADKEGRSEAAIKELELMLTTYFEKDQVKSILKLRNEHESKTHKTKKKKEDFLNYIKFEVKLLRAIRIQHKKRGGGRVDKITKLEGLSGVRVNSLFFQALNLFSDDLAIWLMYIKFCRQMKRANDGERAWKQLLELHGHRSSDLYIQASHWEVEEMGNTESARILLLQGIHVHKESKPLLFEVFKLELLDTDKRRKEYLKHNENIDPANDLLNDKKAEAVYECSLKKFNDVELLNNLLDICSEYNFATSLLNKITDDLHLKGNDERMWDIVAARELKRQNKDSETPFQTKIMKYVQVYVAAIKRLNSERMWEYYIDAMIELEKDSTTLTLFKRGLLLNALEEGANNGKLSEAHYLVWVSKLQEGDECSKHQEGDNSGKLQEGDKSEKQRKQVMTVLQGAVQRRPDSVTLWHMLLRMHLINSDETQVKDVFNKAVAALNSESLPLWKLMIQFEQTKEKNNIVVSQIFKNSFNQSPEVSGPLKIMYLEWLVLTQGISAARKEYEAMWLLPTPCLELHKKMIYLETIQTIFFKKKIRQCYRNACQQFGSRDVGIWLEYCKFEINHGDPKKTCEIYKTAQQNLDAHLFEIFKSEYCLIQTLPIS